MRFCQKKAVHLGGALTMALLFWHTAVPSVLAATMPGTVAVKPGVLGATTPGAPASVFSSFTPKPAWPVTLVSSFRLMAANELILVTVATRAAAPDPSVATRAAAFDPPVATRAAAFDPSVATRAAAFDPPVATRAAAPDPSVATRAAAFDPSVATRAAAPDPSVATRAAAFDPPAVATRAAAFDPPVATRAAAFDPPVATRAAAFDPSVATRAAAPDPSVATRAAAPDPSVATRAAAPDPSVATRAAAPDPSVATRAAAPDPSVATRAAAFDPPAVATRAAAFDPPAVATRAAAFDPPAVATRAAAFDPPIGRVAATILASIVALVPTDARREVVRTGARRVQAGYDPAFAVGERWPSGIKQYSNRGFVDLYGAPPDGRAPRGTILLAQNNTGPDRRAPRGTILLAQNNTGIAILDFLFGARRPKEAAPARPETTRKPQVRRRKPTPVPQQSAPAVAKAPDAKKVLVIGDVFAAGLARGLTEMYQADPSIQVIDRSVAGSGLVRRDHFDWPALAATMVSQTSADAVVVMLGSNDRQNIGANRFGDSAWVATYRARLRALSRAVSAQSVPVFWVGMPVMGPASYGRAMAKINDLIRQQAYRDHSDFVDIWSRFADAQGQYNLTGPDVSGRIRRLRHSNGIHFNRTGNQKLAFFVDRDVRSRLSAADNSDANRQVVGVEISLTEADIKNIAPLAGGKQPRNESDLPKGDTRERPSAYKLNIAGIAPSAEPGRADSMVWATAADMVSSGAVQSVTGEGSVLATALKQKSSAPQMVSEIPVRRPQDRFVHYDPIEMFEDVEKEAPPRVAPVLLPDFVRAPRL